MVATVEKDARAEALSCLRAAAPKGSTFWTPKRPTPDGPLGRSYWKSEGEKRHRHFLGVRVSEEGWWEVESCDCDAGDVEAAVDRLEQALSAVAEAPASPGELW